ncbi:YodC family protein [Pseudomonas aeruginosa]|nr:DUF2158 domain-containing protein [Pseudomonas aeruginosa]
MSDLKLGDVVRLNSGGPKMTVGHIGVQPVSNEPYVRCTWFDERNVQQVESFLSVTVEKVESE